jgi:adenosine deaminase
VEDPTLVTRLADEGIALEVCPASNVALGVFDDSADVPVRKLVDAGVRVALAADDPLLFGARLTDQYEIARGSHGFNDSELADLARSSVEASFAPDSIRRQLMSGIDAWVADHNSQ